MRLVNSVESLDKKVGLDHLVPATVFSFISLSRSRTRTNLFTPRCRGSICAWTIWLLRLNVSHGFSGNAFDSCKAICEGFVS
jgi:hypothetical protein